MLKFIPYFGGKSEKSNEIQKRFPKHECYIEPFLGGGSVFFRKPPSKYEVINDVYDDLINLFRVVKTCPEEFVCELQHTLYSRSLFNQYLNEMKSKDRDQLSNIQKALRMYFLLNVSYGAMRQNFRPMAKCKPALIPKEVDKFIQKVHKRLRTVILECRDYKDIIRIYDRAWSLFFLDPLYHVPGAKKGYVRCFSEDEFIIFERILSEMQGKFLLTINDDNFTRELFKHYRIEEVVTRYNVTQGDRKNFKELYIMNY